MKEVISFILKQEGSTYVSRDGGRESSKFGILQSTARGYGFEGSIRDLTRQEAEAIYEKMWQESGAQRLPRDLAIVHFDTYINSPVAARKMLEASGGDTQNYLDLRAQRYMRLAEERPHRYAKYMKGWMNRVEHLRTMVTQDDNTSSTKAST
jgi:lysozyme family protein